VINALLTIKTWQGKQIVILDDILELGEMAVEEHKEVAIILNQIKPDLLILVGRNYTHIIEETLLNLGYTSRIITLQDELPEAMISNEIRPILTKKNTLILLEGYQSQKFLSSLR
jgi:UDP-N-acetylmuramyl pentapeptide synthase